jgi:hypothetical protein
MGVAFEGGCKRYQQPDSLPRKRSRMRLRKERAVEIENILSVTYWNKAGQQAVEAWVAKSRRLLSKYGCNKRISSSSVPQCMRENEKSKVF